MGLMGGAGEMWLIKLSAQRLALGECSGMASLLALERPGRDGGKGFPAGGTNAGKDGRSSHCVAAPQSPG